MKFILKALLFSLVIFCLPLTHYFAQEPKRVSNLKSESIEGPNLRLNSPTDDFLVNDDTGSADQGLPTIAVDSSGNFIIAWHDYRNGYPSIYVQKYDFSGIPQGYNFKLTDDNGIRYQLYPSAAMDVSGNFVVVWEEEVESDYDIFARRFDFSGVPLGPDFRINDDTGSIDTQRFPAVAVDASGNFVVTWHNFSSVYGSNTYARRYHSSGTALGSSFQVNDVTGTVYFSAPCIALSASGDFLISWEDSRDGAGDIYAQKYDSTGAPLDLNFKVNDDVGNKRPQSPAIAINGSGSFVIAWVDRRNANWDIYAQIYDLLGTPIGENFRVNNDSGFAAQFSPAVAMDRTSRFVIPWTDSRNGPNDIYAQRYSSSGYPLNDNYLVTNSQFASFTQESPEVEATISKIYFCWQDYRRGNIDIFAKVVDWTWTEVGGELEAELANYFDLSQNYPNPFNPYTSIRFSIKTKNSRLNQPTKTTLTIYDILGRKVRTLVDDERLPGNHQVIWDGRDYTGEEAASGIYFYQLKTRDYTCTKKMVLIR